MSVRGTLAIRLRLAPVAFIDQLKKRYCPYQTHSNSMSLLDSVLSTRSNHSIVKQAIKRKASRQSPFDLNLRYSFSVHNMIMSKVFLDIHSDTYLALRSRLRCDLKNVWTLNQRRSHPRDPAFICLQESSYPDPRPRIIILGKSAPKTADRVIEELQRDFPDGFGVIRAEGLVLYERYANADKTHEIASFRFLENHVD